MLAPGQSLVLKELPGGVADAATPPDAPLGALSVQDVDFDTGEPIGAELVEVEPEPVVVEEEAVEEVAEESAVSGEAGPVEEEPAEGAALEPEAAEEEVPPASRRGKGSRSRRRSS